MNAVGTSITAIRSPAAQIIVVNLLVLVIKATLETALSAGSITQVWSVTKLQDCMLMMKSKLIYSSYSQWGDPQIMPVIQIRYERLSRRRSERGAPDKELVHHCGNGWSVKKCAEHRPKRLSKLLIGKRSSVKQETHHVKIRIG